jgi:hypothetical protein
MTWQVVIINQINPKPCVCSWALKKKGLPLQRTGIFANEYFQLFLAFIPVRSSCLELTLHSNSFQFEFVWVFIKSEVFFFYFSLSPFPRQFHSGLLSFFFWLSSFAASYANLPWRPITDLNPSLPTSQFWTMAQLLPCWQKWIKILVYSRIEQWPIFGLTELRKKVWL